MSVVARLSGLLASLPATLRATLLYAGALAWGKGLAMVSIPLMTRMLSPAEFGRLELLSSAAEIGGLIAGAGLVDTLYRFAAAPGAAGQRAAGQVVGLASVVAGIGIAIAVLFSGPLARVMPLATSRLDILLLGVAVALESVIAVPLGWLRMHGRAATFSALSVLRGTVQVGLVVALVATGHGVTGVLLAGCVTCIGFSALLLGGQAKQTGIAIAPRAAGKLLAYGVPLIGCGLASFVLGSADRWLLAGSVPAASLGQYALAAKIAAIVALIAQPFELWWYPQRLALLARPDGLARSNVVVAAGAAFLMLAGAATALAGPVLIALLAPPSYAPAAAMAPLLVLAIVLQLLTSVANAGCYTRPTGALPFAVNAAAAAVALGLYLLLIPRMGVQGAIAATVAAQAFRLVAFATLSQRFVRLSWPLFRLALLAGAATLTASVPQLVTGGAAMTAIGLAALAASTALAVAIGLIPIGVPRRFLIWRSPPRCAAAA